MRNTKLPAYPAKSFDANGILRYNPGFTKLELASLMIAQGILSSPDGNQYGANSIATSSVEIAKAILEEANK